MADPEAPELEAQELEERLGHKSAGRGREVHTCCLAEYRNVSFNAGSGRRDSAVAAEPCAGPGRRSGNARPSCRDADTGWSELPGAFYARLAATGGRACRFFGNITNFGRGPVPIQRVNSDGSALPRIGHGTF